MNNRDMKIAEAVYAALADYGFRPAIDLAAIITCVEAPEPALGVLPENVSDVLRRCLAVVDEDDRHALGRDILAILSTIEKRAQTEPLTNAEIMDIADEFCVYVNDIPFARAVLTAAEAKRGA